MTGLNLTVTGLTFALALLASWVGVAVFRRWSLRRDLMDHPNDRSSHSIPTPRGGGLIIVVVTLLSYAVIAAVFSTPFSWGYFVGAVIVAGVSWFDDLYSLPFWSRLIVHIAAAIALIVDVGYWNDVFVPLLTVSIPVGTVLGGICTVTWVVWLVNAYNFMDGIDGIAALQSTIAGIAWSVIGVVFDLPGVFLFGGLIACSSIGFLIHNWQPAKIFMGDVGSAFLGYTLAALPLLARWESKVDQPLLPTIAVLFVWFFFFDTVLTLVRRAFGKKRIWEAHREHLYQKLVIEGREHATVTILYGAVAAFLSFALILSIIFPGRFVFLAVFSLVVPTALITYFGSRRVDLRR